MLDDNEVLTVSVPYEKFNGFECCVRSGIRENNDTDDTLKGAYVLNAFQEIIDKLESKHEVKRLEEEQETLTRKMTRAKAMARE